MLLLFYISCFLLVSNIQATNPGNEDIYVSESDDANRLWKVLLKTYYGMKGLQNETTDEMVNAFFDHGFKPYPKELYPTFQKIFEYISKSNDRIWNFYESILYLYRNVEATDLIYETVLMRFALGKMCLDFLKETDATLPLDQRSRAESAAFQHRSGAILEEQYPEEGDLPCEDECGIPPLQVGSFRGIPGVNFPNYNEIPITSFTCQGKHTPGFYADLETGCQVFHVCYEHRRESFLCPIGTIFNQAILACDYWYSSNCSLAPLYFNFNLDLDDPIIEDEDSTVGDLLTKYSTTTTASTEGSIESTTSEPKSPKSPKIQIVLPNIDWALMIRFLPIKSKIIEYPEFCETTTAYPTHKPTHKPVTKPTRPTYKPTPVTKPSYPTHKPTPVTRPSYPTRKPTPVTKPTYSTQPTPLTKTTYPTRKPTTVVEPVRTTTPYTKKPIATTVQPKKSKEDIKTAKSEILLDILKAVEELTKDATGFLTKLNIGKIMENKHKRKPVRPAIKLPTRPSIVRKPAIPTREPRYPTKSKPVPGINQRFVVKPVNPGKIVPRPTVVPSKPLKPAKRFVNPQAKDNFRKKDPAKLIMEGMKVISHILH